MEKEKCKHEYLARILKSQEHSKIRCAYGETSDFKVLEHERLELFCIHCGNIIK